MFTVSPDWTNKNNFSSGLLWAGFKSFKPFAPFKIFSAVHKCSKGRFFVYGIYTSSVSAFLLHLFFCVQTRGLDHIWKKTVEKTHQLNLSVLSMILSTCTSIMQKCSPRFCLPWSACRSSGGLTGAGGAVRSGSGGGEHCCCSQPAPLPWPCPAPPAALGEGSAALGKQENESAPPCAVSWHCCPFSSF